MKGEMIRSSASLLVVLVAAFLAPLAASADELVVTKTADTLDGACDADCSLREAVVASNSGPGRSQRLQVAVLLELEEQEMA